MKRSTRIILIEDHPKYREVVDLALKNEKGMDLINQFGTAERALRSIQDCSESEIPDVILLDLNLPGMSGLDSIRWFKEYVPTAKILILTQSDMEADILRGITLGASGYLLKSSTVKEIKKCIQTVMEGGASLDPGVSRFILETLQTTLPKDEKKKEITEREIEVLTLLAEGLVKKEIAERLGISITTVVSHVGHIYEKLQVKNAPAAVSKGYLSGILPVKK